MGELLWVAQGLVRPAASELLDSLDGTRVWLDPLAAGCAFALMTELAASDPVRVERLLPKTLDAYTPEDRAVLGEIHAYACWRLGEHLAVARASLQELDEPDLEGVPQELRLFALRGAVVARLGVIALDGIPQEALVARPVVFRSVR